jgi:phage virion morphogenesis protein
MAGDGVAYQWDDREFQRMLKETIGRVTDFTPAMKSFSEYMVTRTSERFDREQAPDGSGWQSLKPATVAAKQAAGKIDKILQRNGFLRLVHPRANKDSAGVYSSRVYAAIHNRGGMAGRGRRTRIPKREFLGFNDQDIKEFHETVKDWIVMGRR